MEKPPIDRRKKWCAPTFPGNYPKNIVEHYKNNLNQTFNEFIFPKSKNNILLAGDIRNFSKTSSEVIDNEIFGFLVELYNRIAISVQQIPRGVIYKFLGDGFFASAPSDSILEVVEAARKIMVAFLGLKNALDYGFINLSMAIIESEKHVQGMIGGQGYYDFTIIGHRVNELFRTLSCTDGSLIFINNSLAQKAKEHYHYLFVGEEVFKGIDNRTSCYSVIRPKFPEENDKGVEKCAESCPDFASCYYAWEAGKLNAHNDIHGINHGLECSKCPNSKCWNYGNCLPKYLNWKEKEQDTKCCHVCSNFRNCYHSFHLGRQFKDMITCDRDINMFMKSKAFGS